MFRLVLSLCLVSFSMLGQVGVGTTSPNAELDINGDLIIREILEEMDVAAAKDSVLVSNEGLVKRIALEDLLNEISPSAVKGTFSSSGSIALSLLSGPQTIPFDDEDFDTNGEFDTTTYSFTPSQDGIYSVEVVIQATSAIAVATNFGVAVLVNGTVVHKNSFANIGVLGINVTPPVRRVSTLLNLSTSDVVTFQLQGDAALGTVNLIGSSEDSYFTIHRIR